MRYGIFSDVHGNLEALQAVLDVLEDKVDAYICVGDIVGYGPNPNECIETICGLKKSVCVAGNHDKAVVGMKSTAWFNDYAQRVILWTKRKLTDENRLFLMKMPVKYEHTEFMVAHGSPRDPIDEYLMTPMQFQENLTYFKERVCFVGHTHIPLCFIKDRLERVKIKYIEDGFSIKLDPENRFIVNLGSVGQPRDGDVRACAVVLDMAENKVTYHRVSYDIQKVQDKMRSCQLPLFLIERLSEGR